MVTSCKPLVPESTSDCSASTQSGSDRFNHMFSGVSRLLREPHFGGSKKALVSRGPIPKNNTPFCDRTRSTCQVPRFPLRQVISLRRKQHNPGLFVYEPLPRLSQPCDVNISCQNKSQNWVYLKIGRPNQNSGFPTKRCTNSKETNIDLVACQLAIFPSSRGSAREASKGGRFRFTVPGGGGGAGGETEKETMLETPKHGNLYRI